MKTSMFFADLHSSYAAELEDLSQDSEGNDVLAKRLKEKRSQLGELLSMMEFAPEMVAAAFHKAFDFDAPRIVERMLLNDVDDLPDWGEVAQAITLRPWAQPLADMVLGEEGGERFLLLCVGLEYLQGKQASAAPVAAEEEEKNDFEEGDEDENDLDHEDAGAAWLADQGFDRPE